MKLGPLIIVSGPSGSGKSTLIKAAMSTFEPRLRHSISATTRLPRPGEQDGIDYHFWSRERFEAAIDAGELLEYAIVHGQHYYGTPRSEVEPYRRTGVGVILDIDVQGAGQIRKSCPDAFTIFVTTPAGMYEERLRDRKTETEVQIQRRLQTAREELARAPEFDTQLLNDRKDRAAAELIDLIGRRFDSHQGRSSCLKN